MNRIPSSLQPFLPRILLASCVAVVVFLIWKSQALLLPDKSEDNNRLENVLYYTDDSDTLIAREVLALPDSLFHESHDSDINLGFYPGSAWIACTVHSSENGDPVYLEIKNPLLNYAEFYELRSNGPAVLSISGDEYDFYARPHRHRNYVLPLHIPQGESRNLLIRVSSFGEQLVLPIRIWKKEDMDLRDNRDNLIRGSYYGLVIFVLLFNLFIYVVIREESSFYYLIYNLCLLLLQLSLSGHAFHYLWPHNTWLANIANPVLASVSVFALMRFSQKFLSLDQHFPRINKGFNIAGIVLICNALMAGFYVRPAFEISILAVNGIALILNVLIIPIAYLVYRKKFQPAKFFLIAFIVLVLTVFGFILTNFGFIRSEFFSDYGLLIGSAFEVILLSFAIVDRFKSFRDQAVERLQEINRIVQENNDQLEIKVQERTEEIVAQNREIESQKEEIVSSIRYAQRIQQTLLPSDDEVKGVFPEAFVFFKPKDIVSGDFFWVRKGTDHLKGNAVEMFAIGDCTGHGVPGAFMGVMGYNFLDQITSEMSTINPGQVLDQMHERVINALQTNKTAQGVQDGMDIVFCVYDRSNHKLFYSSANQRLLIARRGEIIELDGDHQAIGQPGALPFATREFQLEEGDIIYAFTDGYKDQFGGARSKKLKISGFRDKLLEVSNLIAGEQKKVLSDFFDNWKGQNEQVDDVCVLGIRVN